MPDWADSLERVSRIRGPFQTLVPFPRLRGRSGWGERLSPTPAPPDSLHRIGRRLAAMQLETLARLTRCAHQMEHLADSFLVIESSIQME